MTAFFALYFPDLLPPAPAAATFGTLLTPLHCYKLEAKAINAQRPDDAADPWQRLAAAGRLVWRRPTAAEGVAEAEDLAAAESDLVRLQALLGELEAQNGRDAALFLQGIRGQLAGRGPEQASELVAPLLGQGEDPRRQEAREQRWQAWLLLKLAELQQRREWELEKELLGFATKRAALFRQLRGEDEGEESAAPPPVAAIDGHLEPPRTGRNSKALLRAWSRLFLPDQQAAPLLVTADPDAAELLLGGCDPLTPQPTAPIAQPSPADVAGEGFVLLGSIPLPLGMEPRTAPEANQPAGPGHQGGPANQEATKAWSGKGDKSAGDELAAALIKAARDGDGEPVRRLLAAMARPDEQAAGTPPQASRQQPAAAILSFYLLPGRSLSAAVTALAPAELAPVNKNGRGELYPHGLVAVIRQA